MKDDFNSRYIEERKFKSVKFEIITYLFVFIAALFAMSTVDMFMFSPVEVRGESMTPTLLNEDVLIINKMKKPQRGDIIVLIVDTYNGPEQWIKRLIAVGGDTVWAEDGIIYREYTVNGERVTEQLSEEYLEDGERGDICFDKVTVPEGEIFFMGDNRKPNGSYDSRAIGTVEDFRIVGVVSDFSLRHKDVWKKLFG